MKLSANLGLETDELLLLLKHVPVDEMKQNLNLMNSRLALLCWSFSVIYSALSSLFADVFFLDFFFLFLFFFAIFIFPSPLLLLVDFPFAFQFVRL